MTRREIAINAFYGGNETLMEFLANENGYTMDGVAWPANGFTLAEVIQMVEEMDEDILEALI